MKKPRALLTSAIFKFYAETAFKLPLVCWGPIIITLFVATIMGICFFSCTLFY